MSLLCKFIGHKYNLLSAVQEKPYEGKHRIKDHKPHTRHISFMGCQRCGKANKINHYFFEYFDDMEIPE